MYVFFVKPLPIQFDEATQVVLNTSWTTFYCAKDWKGVLPCPDLEALPKITKGRFALGTITTCCHTMREHELMWENWAMSFFNQNKQQISHQLREMERHLADELAVWNEHHKKKKEKLPLETIHREWIQSINTLSLRQFLSLPVDNYSARQFVTPKFEALVKRYDMPKNTLPERIALPVKIEPSLRQIALFYCYEEKAIHGELDANTIAKRYGHTSGEKLLKFYNYYSRPHNRLGVTKGEVSPFCKNVSVILPYLSPQAKRKAETELNTIKAKTHTGLDQSDSFA